MGMIITEPKPQQKLVNQSEQLETLGLIACGIAHDFSNLLASIIGQSSLALTKLPPEDTARLHIEKAMKAAEFAAELTRQLLSYANANGENADYEPIDLNQLINDNIGLLNMSLLKEVVLQLDLLPYLPPVQAKRGHIQQIVMNLIINAAESIHSGDGVVTIKTGFKYITSETEIYPFVNDRQLSPGEYIYLEVSDNGHGIDEATMGDIFQPFYTTKPKGHGLGLASVLDIVDAYQGGVSVDSAIGEGTTFTVYFPVYHESFSASTTLH